MGLTFIKRTRSRIRKDGTKDGDYSLYKCFCGVEFECIDYLVRKEMTRSCGCLKRHAAYTHRMNKSKPHRTWGNMKQRCYNPKNHRYKNYGAKGVTVCDRWLNSFENFYKDMGDPPSDNHSIDRINPFGNYEPNNCKWSTPLEQARNKRNSLRNKTSKKQN